MKTEYTCIKQVEVGRFGRWVNLYFDGGWVRLDPLSIEAIGEVYGNDIGEWVGETIELITQPNMYGVDVRPVKPPEQIAASRIRIIDNNAA